MAKRQHPSSASADNDLAEQTSKRPRTEEPLFLGGADSPMSEIPDEEDGVASPNNVSVAAVQGAGASQTSLADGTTASSAASTAVVANRDAPHVLPDATLQLLKKLGVDPASLASEDIAQLGALASSTPGGTTSTAAPVAASAKVAEDAKKTVVASGPPPAVSSTSTVSGNDTEKELAIETLVEMGVARHRVSDWAINDLKRLSVLLRWADTKTDVYNLTCAPSKLEWGTPSPFTNHGNILCHEGTSKPITLWIPVEISGQWWFDNDGYPAARPAIAGQPLDDSAAEFCKTLLNERCMPVSSSKVADQFGPSQIKASRWMNERAKKGQPAKTHEFKAVYDARKTLRDKVLLQQLNVGQLKLRDIVVLEVQVGRYSVKDEDDKGKRRAMERWQAFYDLAAVYKLKDATESAQVVAPASDFSI